MGDGSDAAVLKTVALMIGRVVMAVAFVVVLVSALVLALVLVTVLLFGDCDFGDVGARVHGIGGVGDGVVLLVIVLVTVGLGPGFMAVLKMAVLVVAVSARPERVSRSPRWRIRLSSSVVYVSFVSSSPAECILV